LEISGSTINHEHKHYIRICVTRMCTCSNMAATSAYLVLIMTTVCVIIDLEHTFVNGESSADENVLKTKLLANYRKDTRPYENTTNPTSVSMTMSVMNMQGLDEVSGRFSIVDHRFMWNSTEHGEHHDTRLNVKRVERDVNGACRFKKLYHEPVRMAVSVMADIVEIITNPATKS
jgi:hypothetical protein